MVIALVVTTITVFSTTACGNNAAAEMNKEITKKTVTSTSRATEVAESTDEGDGVITAEQGNESNSNLEFKKMYIIMPELDIRADPDTPGAIDTVKSGQEVELLYTAGAYSQFNYQKDGETRTGATWTGAIAPAIRIHLLEDAYVFHKAGQTREELGSISTWREPSDPDLLVLWEEQVSGEDWFYVLSIEDCRAGFMKADVPYEIVE